MSGEREPGQISPIERMDAIGQILGACRERDIPELDEILTRTLGTLAVLTRDPVLEEIALRGEKIEMIDALDVIFMRRLEGEIFGATE